MARLEAAMTDPQRAEEAMARYGPLQEAFDRAGGYTYPARIRRVVRGLGFAEGEIAAPLSRLSGGERTRADLARLLLEDPDLLLLDEPTNHLDLQAIEWLEGWLEGWPGAAVIVSHDRYFLDHSVETVWELDGRKLVSYHGNYSAYAGQRAERLRLQAGEYRAQQDHVRREQDYIRRNIAGQNSRQAQGRRTRLERMLQQEAVGRPAAERNVRIDFAGADRSGDVILETHGLAVGYADAAEALFDVPDLVLSRGECVALIGPNGAGKTTFLKTLLGDLPPLAGTIRLGAGLKIGYFAQAHELLRPDRTVVEEVLSAAPNWTRAQARDFLARFLFTGDSVDKQVEVLSGGERGRVALAKLALEGANLLLLDEPTNPAIARSTAGRAGRVPGDDPARFARPLPDRCLGDANLGRFAARTPAGRVRGRICRVRRRARGA
jgi:ATP-binding cassette subfamily F protein 3